MPRLLQAMKDVISCDKLWGGANILWSIDFRMGQPGSLKDCHPAKQEANAGNWNILVPVGKENKNDSPSSGERTGKSPNRRCVCICGVVGLRCSKNFCEKNGLENPTIDGDSPVFEAKRSLAESWVARDTRNPVWIRRAHPPRLNTRKRPIAYQYREGKVKSTSVRGVK